MLIRRFLSLSARLSYVKSPFPDVKVPAVPLTEFIWETVDKWPDKVAIECGITGRRYKYGELRSLSRKFAGSLRRAGLQPGNTIAVIIPNIPEWPIILLGAIEAGLVVSPANPTYTADELAKQMKDCAPKAVITLSGMYPTVERALGLTGKQLKPLVMIAPGIEPDAHVPRDSVSLLDMIQQSADSPDIRFTGDVHQTVLLPYSSGTTGLPKGVMLSHWNVVASCAEMNGEPSICLSEPATGLYYNVKDVAPAVLPLFHIYGMSVVMLAKMCHGTKLVTLPKFEPNTFFNVLDKNKATILFIAPPLMLFLNSHPGIKQKHFEATRYILSGAAPLGRSDIERFLNRVPSVDVLQAYGMTETAPGASHRLKGCTKHESVGVPIPNTEIKVTDVDSGVNLPPGKVGEICIRAPQVMKGYFNKPEETEQTIKDGGWLHTGDLGHYDQEGCFYVVDRLKELIKVKGFQVTSSFAPAELEEVLRRNPDVLDAAGLRCDRGGPDKRSGEIPKAFIVPKHSNVSPEDIQNFVSQKVSSHKQLKGGIEFIDSIPKNASGKILRRKLRENK
ncbi:hypothetical protein L9F63_020424 [Diploptera punctata]|uniref:Uncharacterized protein n=1 Tax=Diploptera punctata TaxID=6984 RepID=A0AAD7ZT03_DIPPU|nr:hypothetical protein L9F63_020424 [Diploptera punctata]